MPLYAFGRYECLELPLSNKFDRITIDPALAVKLQPVEVKPGVSLATVTGKLKVNNNKYHLLSSEAAEDVDAKPPSKRQRKEPSPLSVKNKPADQHLFGKIHVSNLLQSLTAQGISTVKVEEPGPGSFIIHLERDEALIRIEDQETHVVCEDPKGNTRELIRQCIFSCLNTF